jgi:hypothetical protein
MANENSILGVVSARGGRVSIADLAAARGTAPRVCARQLNRLAQVGGAILEIGADGSVDYVFPASLTVPFATHQARKCARVTTKALCDVAFWLLRCSFGVLLAASFVSALVVCIVGFVIMACFTQVTGIHCHGNLFHLLQIFDLQNLYVYFSWRGRHSSNSEFSYLGQRLDFGGDGLFHHSYSFLFGDSDPNQVLKDEYPSNIATLILRNHGAISWEQVVPLLPAPTASEEEAMFPLLVRFNGMPQVNAARKIFYVFPEMQATDDGARPATPDHVEEMPWQFTEAPIEKMFLVIGFGILNLGAWFLISRNSVVLEILSPHEWILSALMAYAAFFLMFPSIRQFINILRNGAIDYRNSLRQQAAAKLAPPAVHGQHPHTARSAHTAYTAQTAHESPHDTAHAY